MGRMIFDLTDEDREGLEALRRVRGDRSQAETLRGLIREARSNGDWRTMRRLPVGPAETVLLHKPKAFNPQPKQGKKP